MNYTGRPSISGCRPVLSLYPTHCFCQYLLLIFITFTNSSLFNRAFSTNSRSPLSHAVGVTVPGCALSVSLRSTAPPRGEPLAGRFTSYWTTEARYGAKGWALLAGAGASLYNLSVSLRSTAPLVGEPLAKPFTLRGLPRPLLQGEVASRQR